MHQRARLIETQALAEHCDVTACRSEMESARATAVQIATETRERAYVGLFCVDCSRVNARLLAGLGEWATTLLHAFQGHTTRLNDELRHEYKDVAAKLVKKPMDLYELVDAEAFVRVLKSTRLHELQRKADAIEDRVRFLLFERGSVRIDVPSVNTSGEHSDEELSHVVPFRVSPELLTTTVKTLKWRSDIAKLLSAAETSLVTERARIETIFLAKRTRFQAEIEEFDADVRSFAKKGDLRHAATYVVQLAKMNDTLVSFRTTTDTIVAEERKLQWKTTDFSKLDDIADAMEPYEQLWKTAREFREMSARWLRGNVFELEPSDGSQTLHEMLATVSNVSKRLHMTAAATALTAEMVKKQIADFCEAARLAGAILNPSMQARHRNDVAALVGVPLDPDEPVTLLKLLENGALEHLPTILAISQNATQEKLVEAALAEIAAEWHDVAFAFETPVSTLSEGKWRLDEHSTVLLLRPSWVEEMHCVVEETQVRLTSLLCLQHAVPFASEIASWLQFTQSVRRLVDVLSSVGRAWKALHPLVAASVVEPSSKEANLFSDADTLYKAAVLRIQQQPLCRELVTRTIQSTPDATLASAGFPADAVLTDLEACLELLEAANEALRVGLDTKRLSFPRFCFLSDLELVTALSCRNTTGGVLLESPMLWATLAACFPDVHSVRVNSANEITAVSSRVGETFSLGTPIATTAVAMTSWLGKVETATMTMLQASVRAAVSDASRKEFRKWCLLWPEQVLLVAIQHTWTLQCEHAQRRSSGHERLSAWGAIIASLRERHGAVGRELKAAALAHVKVSLSNVLSLLRHLQDVSTTVLQELQADAQQELLNPCAQDASSSTTVTSIGRVSPNGTEAESLSWLAQPRYYYEDNALVVKVGTAAPIAYGFEYLGNRTPAFFLTPLTLRCFHAIAQTAAVLGRGSCLQGAGGTGKTALVSAFATTCGHLLARFECGNSVALTLLLQFVRGAAASGAWLMMEHFQVLESAQAAVVGYVCTQVMDALAAKQTHCVLLGDKLRLKRGCHFSVLLQSVGDSSKSNAVSHHHGALFFFRTIEVQSPSVEIVTERLLHQGRFTHATMLSKLIVAVLSAFERGFALARGDRAYRADAAGAIGSFLNLRFVRRVVKHAVAMSWSDSGKSKAQSFAQTALRSRSSLDADLLCQSQDVINTRRLSNDTLDTHEVEKLERKLVCLALREELNAVLPATDLELIDWLLRDVSANSVTRELRTARSFRAASRVVVSVVDETATSQLDPQHKAEQPEPTSLEDAVEAFVRTKTTAWVAFGPSFGLKTVHLLQVLTAGRAAVVSGGIQCGKTALYTTLAHALSYLAADLNTASPATPHVPDSVGFSSNEVVAPTRCVVLVPRALTLASLFGSSAEHFGSTLLANVIRDAKRWYAQNQARTWLVFDSDVSSSWCDTLVYLVEELQDDSVAGDRKGLLLASGKRVLFPHCMRLVLETTQLATVSPSFLTRVGVVNVGNATSSTAPDWRRLYEAWKQQHAAEFSELAAEIVGITDALVDKTVDSALAFVETSFQHGFPQLRVTRIHALLALFHSSLVQSWAKVRAMASVKQRATAIHCFYLQAVVWGIGSTSDTHERQRFHEFLRHWIIHGPHAAQSSLKRVLVLFFPSDVSGNAQSVRAPAATGVPSGLLSHHGGARVLHASTTATDLIYAFTFSVEYGLKWMRWPEYYDHWLQKQHANLSAGGSANGRSRHRDDSGESAVAMHATLIVPTEPMAAAICLMNQLLLANYPVLLDGPADSGKSACGTAWLTLNDGFSRAHVAANATIGQPGATTSKEANPSTATQFQRVFVGHSTTSADVLDQIVTMLERPDRDHKTGDLTPDATLGHHLGTYQHSTGRHPSQAASGRTRKRLSFVFIDDLHCVNTAATMDSAVEQLRMLVDHRQAVHSSLNRVVSTANILPLAALQASRVVRLDSDGHRDVVRLTSRFVRVTLPLLTDADVASICQATVRTPILLTSATVGDAQDAPLLVSIVIRASIKLFRFLSGDFSLNAAKTPFDPSKLHYQFRVREVQDVVRSVCCDSTQPLSLADKPLLARLWCHESARTFSDRLRDSTELAIFHEHTRDIALASFSLAPDVLFPAASAVATDASHRWPTRELHFTFIGESSGAGLMDGYREVSEMHKVELSVERSMMAMYRANVGAESLEVVICGYVLQHVLRLARLLRHSGQNVLLLGSSGKRMAAITRLAAFICRKVAVVYSVPAVASADNDDRRSGAAWKRALKSVVLRSVRNRDERVVFIVKDVSLTSVDHWDAVERFVSGGTLSSDILSYDDLDDNILGILREHALHDQDESRRGSSSGKLLASPRSFGSKLAVLEYFFTQVRERLQIVIILSEPPPRTTSSADHDVGGASRRGTLTSVLWKTPQMLKHCAIDYFGNWPDGSLAAIALKRFAMSADVGKDRAEQLSQVAAQIYLSTQRCFDRCCRIHLSDASDDDATRDTLSAASLSSLQLSWHDQIPSPRLDPSLLLDQVGLFLKFADPLQRDIAANQAKYATGLTFLDSSEQILAAEHAQTQVLQPEMQKRTELTRRMSGSLEREQLASGKLDRALELAISLADAQQERLVHAEAEYRDLVSESMSAFAEMRTAIAVFHIAKCEELEAADTKGDNTVSSSLRDDSAQQRSDNDNDSVDVHSAETDTNTLSDSNTQSTEQTACEDDSERELRQHRRALIKSFASLQPVPAALKQLAECLGLILKIEPVEARDELDPDEVFLDYWESVTGRAKTTAFWADLVAYDIEARVNDKILARILPVCTSPDFEVELFTSLHALAGQLCAYVKTWSTCARAILLAGPKFAQLVLEREAFASAQHAVHVRKREIATQQTTTTELNALRYVSELERKAVETRLQNNASTLQMATSVSKLLATSRTKWRAAYEYYTALSAQWIGDLMVGTSVVAYASSVNAHVRAVLRSQWSAELRRHSLVHSVNSSRGLNTLFLVDDLRVSRWHLDGLPIGDTSAVENAVIITSAYRFPVLIDPYGMATGWIKWCEVGGGTLQELSCNSVLDHASASATWMALETAAKKQQAVLLTDFSEESAFHLRSLLGAKRRSLFEAVNRDISALSTSVGSSSASNTSGMSRFGLNGDTNAGSYLCWFEIPAKSDSVAGSSHSTHRHRPQHRERFLSPSAIDSDSLSPPTTVEFRSDAWRVYLVYSRTDSVPHWMLAYWSQLSIVTFDFSSALIEAQCLSRITSACGEQHVLTETHALRLDAIACQEQMDAIENEILDFFSTEPAERVYADVSKSLRVIGNRSALHTLANSKTEAESKILANSVALERHRMLLNRAVDVALTWRDVNSILKLETYRCFEDADLLALPWVWTLLTRSLQHSCAPHAAVGGDTVDVYTSHVQSYTAAALSDENQVVFAFLLALRVHARAVSSLGLVPTNTVDESDRRDESPRAHRCRDDATIHRDVDVLSRTMQVLQRRDETAARNLCASVPATLVALRPDSVSLLTWRAVCYLADVSSELREYVLSTTSSRSKRASAWTELTDTNASGRSQVSTRPFPELSPVLRLCTIAVVHSERLVSEIEHFTTLQLNSEASDPTLFDLWRTFSSARTPIVVNASRHCNLLHQVERVALKAKMTIDRQLSHDTLLSASDTADDGFERKLLAAMQNGHWTVLTTAHTTPSRLARLGQLFDRLDDQQLHSDFCLWLSSVSDSDSGESGRTTTSGFANALAVYKFQSSGSFTLQRSVTHAFALLADDSQCNELASSGGDQLLKRAGLLHALLTAGDHFGFAPWNASSGRAGTTSFGDSELEGMIRVIAHLLATQAPPTNAAAVDALARGAHDAATTLYGAGLATEHDRLLLECCVDLVLSPDSQTSEHALGLSSGSTVPAIASMLQRLDSLSWTQVVRGEIHCLWQSDDGAAFALTSVSASSDTVRLQRRRGQRLADKLALLLEGRGCSMVTRASESDGGPSKPPRPQSLATVGSPLEDLLTLAAELDGAAPSESDMAFLAIPSEYKKPLAQLVRHELEVLNSVRLAVLDDIRRMQAVRVDCVGCSTLWGPLWCLPHSVQGSSSSLSSVLSYADSCHRFPLALNTLTRLRGPSSARSRKGLLRKPGCTGSRGTMGARCVVTPAHSSTSSTVSHTVGSS